MGCIVDLGDVVIDSLVFRILTKSRLNATKLY